MPLLIKTVVDIPSGQAIGFNEDLCLYLEKFGDAWVISVEECTLEMLQKEPFPEQITLAESMKHTRQIPSYEEWEKEREEMIKTFRDICEHCGFNDNGAECSGFRDEDGEGCGMFKWRKYWNK